MAPNRPVDSKASPDKAPGKARVSSRRDEIELRQKPDRRAKDGDRRAANTPVMIEKRAPSERRATSDRREFERRSGRGRRNDPWPA